MSYKPPVTGRVKSIKSKFENLNSFESLDISSSSLAISHLSEPQPRTSFLFKRSATSIELPAQKCRDKFPVNTRRHTKAASADAFALKYRNLTASSDCADDEDKLEPLKEIKENVEVRFNRHTSDPVKRGSIKRSPAFRVGDKSGKGVVPKHSAPVNKKLAADSQRSSPVAEKLQEIGMTDTLKAVLKQPLPTGPPPKKPPRTFVDSPSPRGNRQPAHMFARAAKADAIKKSLSPPRELQNKIDFLENELVLKPKVSRSTLHASSTKHKPFSSSLLRCIPCSSTPVYDTMTISRRTSEQSQTPRNDENRIDAVSSTSTLITQSLDKPKKNVSEHIYMEPFAHLKLANLNNNNNTSDNHNHHHHHHSNHCGNGSNSRVPDPNGVGDAKHTSTPFSYPNNSRSSTTTAAAPSPHNGSSLDNESIDSSHISCTSCAADDHSMSDLSGDIHYMVSSIETSLWAHGIRGIYRANQICVKIIRTHGGLCIRRENVWLSFARTALTKIKSQINAVPISKSIFR